MRLEVLSMEEHSRELDFISERGAPIRSLSPILAVFLGM